MSTLPGDLTITYKSAPSGRIQAAYIGIVRIGYVEQRGTGRWLWQLSLTRPVGGIPLGTEDDEDSAKDELAKALAFWIDCAGLRICPQYGTEQKEKGTRGATNQEGSLL